MIYGAKTATGGLVTLATRRTSSAARSVFEGAGGEFDDRSGAAHAYPLSGGGARGSPRSRGSDRDSPTRAARGTQCTASAGSVTLSSANANVIGGGNFVTFASGGMSEVSLYGDATNWDTVAGDGGVVMLNGGSRLVRRRRRHDLRRRPARG